MMLLGLSQIYISPNVILPHDVPNHYFPLRTAIAKRIAQIAKTKGKFSAVAAADLSDVQKRCLDFRLQQDRISSEQSSNTTESVEQLPAQ